MAFTGCPNKNTKEWKDLVEQFGENLSSSLFHRNNGNIPSVDEASSMIKASKIGQFKKAVNYINTTTSAQVTDLLPNLFKIIQKSGDDYYVVKGASLDQKPAKGADFEIHQANLKFLQGVNKEFGPVFTIDKVDVNPEITSLKNDIISMIRDGEFKSMFGITTKSLADNPEMHTSLLEGLSEQVKDSDDRRELERTFGPDFVDKLQEYNRNLEKQESVDNRTPEKITNKLNTLQASYDRLVDEAKEQGKNPDDDQSLVAMRNRIKELADQREGLKPAVKPSDDTYRVTINQDALNDIAARNVEEKGKQKPLVSTESTLSTNDAVMNNKAPQYSKAYGEAQVAAVNKNVLNFLKDKFNLPFEIISDPTADWRGKFENGKITINSARVNEWTAVHEYLHPFVGAMEKDNVELYNNLITELTETEEGRRILEDTKELYPELSAKEQAQEALVEHLSRLARTEDIKQKPWYQKFMDWFREMFSKNGISISGLDMKMSLADVADKIIDPTYTADLKRYYGLNDEGVNYQKAQGDSDSFDQLVDKIKTTLKLDVSIQPKNEDEKQRKYFSGRQLKALEEGKDVYKAINDYVTSAIIGAKKISDKFDEWRNFYEANKGNVTKDMVQQGAKILSEMENHQILYKESRYVIDAIRDENPEEYEDNFSLLANRLNKDSKIINNYNEYGLKLMADWLYPSTKKVVEGHIKSGNKTKMPGYEEYLQVKKENPNLNDNQAVEMGVKKWLKGQMQHATSDVGFFNSYLTGVLNSKDPISQLVALSLKDEFAKNNDRLFRVKNGIKEQVKKIIGDKLFTTNAQHKQFYSKYLREVNHWEKTGVDEKGNPTYGYVKRMAFHEPYRYDDFYNDKREFFNKLGARPNKNDVKEYAAWEAKKNAWFDKNSVRVFNDKGEAIKTLPGSNYINPEHAALAKDPLFNELYNNYKEANGKLEQYQLKYGIIPQKPAEGNIFSDLKLKKGLKGNLEAIKQGLKGDLGAELGTYYAQDIDGREYKNVPIQFTRMVDNEDLDYNLGQSVADFWASSSKYETAKNVEPMVLALRSFIEGNATMNVAQRDAPEVDAKGVKKMGKFVNNVLKTKDQANINRQLIDFVNDTVYGDAERKANIKSPFLNLKYLVYKTGDTSANGKPHKEYVYSLEDLKQKTGNQSIDYDHFAKGSEKKVGDYNVTLLSNDKIVSVNKIGRKLNTVSAAVNLGINVTAGASHLLRGVASNFIEATGGKYFNNKDWAAAYKDYFKRLVDFSFLEDVKGGKGSLISQHLTHYGTFQGEFLDEYGHDIGKGAANKLFRKSAMFFSLHGAEHLIQTTQMLAAMKHVKVQDGTGKMISLDKAWEIGQDGYRKLKDGVKWSKEQDDNFKDTLQSINKDRGNYSEFDKAGISRLWWGKMLIMFRRHIMNGIKTRFGSDYVDFERGNATQGYYRSFMTSLVSEYNEFRLNGKFRKLTADEQYHAKKTLADLGMFATLASVIVPALRNKDEHDPDTSDYLALFARRLQMDVSFYINPLEWKKIIQSPVVTGNSVDKIYDFLHQATISPSEEYQKDGSGYRAGDNKAMHKLGKIIPGYREFINLQDPQELLKFYDLEKSSGGGQ